MVRAFSMEVHYRRRKYYRCPNCGYILAKKDAKISGYDSEQTLCHIIAQSAEKSSFNPLPGQGGLCTRVDTSP